MSRQDQHRGHIFDPVQLRASTLYKSQINYKNRVSSTKSPQEVEYAYPARSHSNPAAAL